MANSLTEAVLIIDFGSQVTQLIARRVRECGVYSEIVPFAKIDSGLCAKKYQAVILSGSHHSVLEKDAPYLPQDIFAKKLPILGICYGQQLMCQQLGGTVEANHKREFGRAFIEIVQDSLLFEDIGQKGERCEVWMSHGDRVVYLPPSFSVIARSGGAPFAAIADEARGFYGVQFHPEVVHTKCGAKLIENFLYKIAGLKGGWTMAAYREESIKLIKQQVGDGKVICGLSGGVDSAVTAVLIHRAIGDQLTCIFVDHGLLRKGEAEQITKLFNQEYNIKLVHVEASKRFLQALTGIVDPEEKRKIIGRLFVEIFEEEAKKLGGAKFLAQGTLYPDVIESVSLSGSEAVTIKSHHNVGGLPEHMNLILLEPLRALFKDEVRVLGAELNLPLAFLERHPFPGPGLAVRCPGEVTQEKLAILREADAIYLSELRNAGLYNKIWQAFAVLLPVKTVGVMGDGRSYEYVCALRAVTSVDGMTADFYPFDMNFLAQSATRIINEVPGINRVVYDVTSKPPGTIEWE